MLYVCYPRCSTCKKAQNWLDEKGLKYDLRDIKTDNPSYEELKSLYEKKRTYFKKILQYKRSAL